MLQMRNDLAANKLISIYEDSIKEVGGSNMVYKTGIVGKANMRFFTPETRLAFTKLRQALSIARIFYYFNLQYYVLIKTNISDYAISKILS